MYRPGQYSSRRGSTYSRYTPPTRYSGRYKPRGYKNNYAYRTTSKVPGVTYSPVVSGSRNAGATYPAWKGAAWKGAAAGKVAAGKVAAGKGAAEVPCVGLAALYKLCRRFVLK